MVYVRYSLFLRSDCFLPMSHLLIYQQASALESIYASAPCYCSEAPIHTEDIQAY
jgi:hypothetical protein